MTTQSKEIKTHSPIELAHGDRSVIIAPQFIAPDSKTLHQLCESPLRITLDTNVWLDWLVFDDPGIRALQSWVAQGQACLTAHSHMRMELDQVLNRIHWRGEPIAHQAAALLASFDALVQLQTNSLPTCPWRCSDPDDQIYLDWLSAGFTDVVLTKDKALLRLARTLTRAGRGTIEHPRFATAQWFMDKMPA
jgi:uncharacterized protein